MDILRSRVNEFRSAAAQAENAERLRLEEESRLRQESRRAQTIQAQGHAILDTFLTRAARDVQDDCVRVADALVRQPKRIRTDRFAYSGLFKSRSGWLLFQRDGREGYEAPDERSSSLISSYEKHRGAGRMLCPDGSVCLFTTDSKNRSSRDEGSLDLVSPYVTGRSAGRAIGFEGVIANPLQRIGIIVERGITPTFQHEQRATVLSTLTDDLARLVVRHELEI